MYTETLGDVSVIDITLPILPEEVPLPEQPTEPMQFDAPQKPSPEEMLAEAQRVTREAMAALATGETYDVTALDPRRIGPETIAFIRQLVRHRCIMDQYE